MVADRFQINKNQTIRKILNINGFFVKVLIIVSFLKTIICNILICYC